MIEVMLYALAAFGLFAVGFLTAMALVYVWLRRNVVERWSRFRDDVWPKIERQLSDLKELLHRVATRQQTDPVSVEEHIGVALHREDETEVLQ